MFSPTRCNACLRRLGLLLLVTALGATALSGKDKNEDVVIFRNGDRLTGEIKSMKGGVVRFEHAGIAQAVEIDWSAIGKVITKRLYIVTLSDGTRLTGQIAIPSEDSDQLVITGPRESRSVKEAQVVELQTTKPGFWRKLKGGVDLGFSFAQGNSQVTNNAHAQLSYPTPRFSIATSYDTQVSTQSSGAETSRNEITLDYQRYFRRNWIFTLLGDWLQSSQQQLDLRTTLGTGMGRYLIRTNRTTLAVLGGAVMNRETFSPGSGVPTSGDTQAEGLVGVSYTTFRFLKGEFRNSLNVFPSMTEAGRYRLSLNSDFLLTPTRKLYWRIGLYENYDSAPPVDTRKNDFGTTVSFGWKW